ncbi:hypothetical protein ACFLWJ_00890 [Chloroflexota bacterium]
MDYIQESGNVYKQIERLFKEALEQEVQSKSATGRSRKHNLYISKTKGKLLIIDDNPELLAELLQWCATKDYDVTVARSKKEADLLMKQQYFDTVIKSSEITGGTKRRKRK